MDGTSSNALNKMVYGIIGNIPADYHSSNLRNYFSQFMEPGGFNCFHFRHRPEQKKPYPQAAAEHEEDSPDNLNVDSSTIKSQTKKTMCCVVRLKDEKMTELLRMYHRKHWQDQNGDSIRALCFISRIKVRDKSEYSYSKAD